MPNVSRNAVCPLHMLLQASMFPEMAIEKLKGNTDILAKVQQDEMLDSIDQRALPWNQLVWEWAVEDGQIALSTIISEKASSANVKLAGFNKAISEIQQVVELEFSLPLRPRGLLGPVQGVGRLKPMKSWRGRRLHLVERSEWTKIDLRRLTHVDGSVALKTISPEALKDVAVFGMPSMQIGNVEVGEPWVRISDRALNELETDLVNTLESLSELGKARFARFRDVVHVQQPSLDEVQLKLLNNHLGGDIFNELLSDGVRRLRARKHSEPEALALAKRMVEGLRKCMKDGMRVTPDKTAKHVFISYSRKDSRVLDKLLVMLSPLIRNKVVKVWYDRKMKPSQSWRIEIDKAMEAASVALLLVSKDFLHSDFINDKEMPYLLEAAKKRGVKLLWVLVSHCLYGEVPLADVMAVTSDLARPLNSLHGAALDKELKRVAEAVKEAFAN